MCFFIFSYYLFILVISHYLFMIVPKINVQRAGIKFLYDNNSEKFYCFTVTNKRSREKDKKEIFDHVQCSSIFSYVSRLFKVLLWIVCSFLFRVRVFILLYSIVLITSKSMWMNMSVIVALDPIKKMNKCFKKNQSLFNAM